MTMAAALASRPEVGSCVAAEKLDWFLNQLLLSFYRSMEAPRVYLVNPWCIAHARQVPFMSCAPVFDSKRITTQPFESRPNSECREDGAGSMAWRRRYSRLTSMNTTEGLATSSTAMVSLFRCSTLSPVCPGRPTRESLIGSSSTKSITWMTASRQSKLLSEKYCQAIQCRLERHTRLV